MEILDSIFNLSIALIAVAVSVYAISASLLGSQLKRNVLFVQRRLRETESEIKLIQKISSSSRKRLSDIEEELERFKKEEKYFQDILFCLTVRGAVLYPCVYSILAILSVVIGLIFPTYVHLIALVASSFVFLGSYRIYCTLKSIDFAATNIPLPDFEVAFAGDKQSLEIEAAKTQNLFIEISNSGYDIGELITISIFFPPNFIVHKSKEYMRSVQPKDESSSHPSYTGVFYELDNLHVDMGITFGITITSPEDTNTYKIPAYVNERKITEQEFELEIVVK